MWLEQDDTLKLILSEDILKTGEAPLSEEAAAWFGFSKDDYEKRIIIYYEGREFPSYLEAGDTYGILSWSKALLSRILGEFPDFEDYFKEHEADEDGPALLFDEESEGVYLTRLYLPWSESLSAKQAFFDAIGIGDDTDNFEDAYEIVFLKIFFEELSGRGQSDAFMVAGKLKKYFEKRMKETGEQDRAAKETIDDIEHAGLDVVLSFLMEGPYKKYTQLGLMNLKRIDDHFVFALTPELIDEISTDDKSFLIDNLDEKLTAYFDRQDAPGLSDSLNAFMSDYSTYYGKDFRYSFKDVILQAIPAGIMNTGIFSNQEFKTTGFAGVDTWTQLPYITIRPKEGDLRIQYLLDPQPQKLYLALTLDASEIEKELRRSGVADEDAINRVIRQTADTVRESTQTEDFDPDVDMISLPDDRIKSSILFFKNYEGEVPDDEAIEDDLQKMADLLKTVEHRMNNPEEAEEAETEEALNPEESEDITLSEEAADMEEAPEVEEAVGEVPDEAFVEETVEEAEEEEPEAEAIDETVEAEVAAPEETEGLVEEEAIEVEEVIPVQPVEEVEAVVVEEPPVVEAEPQAQSGVSAISQAMAGTRQVIASHEPKHEEAPKTQPAVTPISREVIENAKRILTHEPAQVPAVPTTYRPRTAKEGLKVITENLLAQGMKLPEEEVDNLYLSIRTSPLLGIYGSAARDRDRLVRSFAGAIGATSENGRFRQIRMKNQRDAYGLLFGERDRMGLLEEVAQTAAKNPDLPYILYLKDLPGEEDLAGELSSLFSSREMGENGILSDTISAYRDIRLPENLFVILSPDESREVHGFEALTLMRTPQMPYSGSRGPRSAAKVFDASFFTPEYARFIETETAPQTLQDVISLLEAMNTVLTKAGAGIGHAQMDEILLYLYENSQKNLMRQETALDYVLLQKVIPGISGEGEAVESVLIDLFKICAGTQNDLAARSYQGQGGLFPKSAGKLSEMIRMLDQTGKTSVFTK